MDFPSFSTLFQIARTEALIRNPQLTRDAIDREGSDANILLAAAAAAADEVIGQLVAVSAGLYTESATGDALDRLLTDRYGLVRKTATAAVGNVTFTLPATNPTEFVIPINTQLGTAEGSKYETTASTVFTNGATSLIVPIRALLAGAETQARPNTITSILSSIAGAPDTLTVTNTQATVGAADRESDTDYRRRGQQFFSTVRRGTLAALVQGALSVPGVVTAQVFEWVTEAGTPYPFVELVVTDQYTDALADFSTVPPAYSEQSQQLAVTVTEALNAYRPAGLYVRVRVASTILQPVTLALTYVGGVDTDAVAQSARASVVLYINNLTAGQPLDPDALIDVLRTVPGLYITGNEIASPSGVVSVAPQKVLRTTMQLVRTLSVDGVLTTTV